jgi:hypothetical protein
VETGDDTTRQDAASSPPRSGPLASPSAGWTIARDLRRPLCTLAIFVKATECWLDNPAGSPGEIEAAVTGALAVADEIREKLVRLHEISIPDDAVDQAFELDQMAAEAAFHALRTAGRERPRLALRLEAAGFRGRGNAPALSWSLRELLRAAIASTPSSGEVSVRSERNDTGARLIVEARSDQPFARRSNSDPKGDADVALDAWLEALANLGATVAADVALDGSRTQQSIEFAAAN